MKKYLWLLLSLLTLVSCEENVGGDDADYSDWKRRNEAYYRQKLQEAKTAVLSAQAQYGDCVFIGRKGDIPVLRRGDGDHGKSLPRVGDEADCRLLTAYLDHHCHS